MKQITKQIKDFLLAFDLAHPVTGVYFDAMVFFYTNTLVLEIGSEIHIITILAKKIDVLYVLNPEISRRGFPDMFEAAHYEIDFREKKGLLLKDINAANINYSILIQPNGKDCEPATLQEIQSKMCTG